MQYPAPEYEIDGEKFPLLSLQEYKDRIGQPDLPTPTLDYKMEHNKLDYVKLGTFRYIIYNKKAQEMEVSARRPRKQPPI